MVLEKCTSIETGLQQETLEAINASTTTGIIAKIKMFVDNITVEPVLFCYTFPSIMCMYAMQNLNLEKVCRVNLNYSEQICDAMTLRNRSGYGDEDEKTVQRYVATINAYKNGLHSFLPPRMLLFLGSWSDRHGRRKPCMTLAIAGDSISAVLCIVSTYFYYELPVEFNVFAEGVPQGFSGSWIMMYMAVSSYIGTTSSVETRTIRLGALHIFNSVCCAAGTVISGLLYKLIGASGIFYVGLFMYFVGYLYLHFKVDEIPEEKEKSAHPSVGFWKDVFDPVHIKDTFVVAFKDGKNNRKKRILVIMFLVVITVGPGAGELGVLYLYVRYRFGWDEVDFSMYCTFSMITHLLGMTFYLMLFNKILVLDDSVMGMISCFSKIASSFVYSLAPSSFVFYLGVFVEMLNGTSFIAMRSIISKLASADELGKLNSLFAIGDGIAPLAYGPLYTVAYNQMLDTFPGFFFILGGILTIPSVIIFFWLYKEHQRDIISHEIVEKEQQEKFLKENDIEKENTGENIETEGNS